MNYLSLFSGIGGLDLGLDRAGWTCVGQVEIDSFCRAVLAKHWPEVPRHDDVRTCIEWWRSEPRPAVDAVVGGFPCQPVSVAGRQKAQADERWLWPDMARVIRDLRPQWAVLENVPGLLGRGMGDVLGDLAACGFDAQWDCVPAAAVGAPHLRYRVFVVAHASSGELWDQPRRGGGSSREGAAVAGNDGTVGHVADTDGSRCRLRPRLLGTPRRRFEPPHGSAGLADPNSARCHPRQGMDRAWAPPVRGSWWDLEPDVGRVAYGIPGRVDRLRALGNAVVPQVAEHIGRMVNAMMGVEVGHDDQQPVGGAR